MKLPDNNRVQFSHLKLGPVYEAVLTPGTVQGASFTITVHWLHRDLLLTALRLARAGENQAAVVLAQTASEVQVERAIAALLRKRRLSKDTREAFTGYLRSYNLHKGNKQLRKLWEALSEDKTLTHQSFWANHLPEHVERRNAVAHSGEHVAKEEAAQSIHVVLELMEHMEGVLSKLIPPRKVRVRKARP